MSDWQPIETAPKDGTRIKLRRHDCPGYDTTGYWSGERFECSSWFLRGDMWLFKNPTHWMPLPEPPTA